MGRLLLIGLNRPQHRNTIDRVTANQLTRIVQEEFEADPTVYGGVLYGCGEDFCTGLDRDELLTSQTACLNRYGLDENSSDGPMGPTRMHLSKPLIAAITGKAIGGGLELALACDLRVAETDSVLGLHPRKYCLPMMDMGAQRLPALIGLSRALDLVLTGRSLTGAEGLQFGLINRLAKPGTAAPHLGGGPLTLCRIVGNVSAIGIAVDLVNTMCNLPGQAALRADRNATIQAANSDRCEAMQNFRLAMRAMSLEGLPGLFHFVSLV
ncbi:unnamed protein product [Echinostoma caproni]|uniref:Enoyl-CoA hydratase n=1 Tax=Echinostoma caproni TaxID=27848 RepID=A0A3P8K9X7_9TREM|nr:unnamed protein product [Echinostoma caproni]